MAGFSRTTLKGFGLTDEQLEKVMTLHGTSMSDYTLKSEVQAQIDAAVAAKPAPALKVEDSEEYKKLLAENTKIKALQTDDFAGVKQNYREMVYDMLDHSEKHKPYTEQLPTIREKYAEMFTTDEASEQPTKPQFGAPTQGSLPTGEKGPSFEDTWGFVPKNKGDK